MRGSRATPLRPKRPDRVALARRDRRAVVAALEALDASGRVDQLLLAGEERMAGAADLQANLVLGRMRLEGVAARAGDGHHIELGMDVFLHGRDPSLSLRWFQEPERLADPGASDKAPGLTRHATGGGRGEFPI